LNFGSTVFTSFTFPRMPGLYSKNGDPMSLSGKTMNIDRRQALVLAAGALTGLLGPPILVGAEPLVLVSRPLTTQVTLDVVMGCKVLDPGEFE